MRANNNNKDGGPVRLMNTDVTGIKKRKMVQKRHTGAIPELGTDSGLMNDLMQ